MARLGQQLIVHVVHRDRNFRKIIEKIVEQDLNWQHRQERQDERGARHREHVSEIRTGAHHDIFHDIAEGAAAFAHAAFDNLQVMVEQNNIRGVLCDVHGAVDRDADIGGVKRGRIVDAVAEITHHMPATLERQDDAVLLRRRDPAK